MDRWRVSTAVCALFAVGCQPSDAQSAHASPDADVAQRYDPWEVSSCRVLLKNRADGAHVAWIATSQDYGMHLETHVHDIESLPHVTDLGLRLRADGDPKREIAARAQRGDDESDSANLLSVILDSPQRKFIDSAAAKLTLVRGNRTLIEIPVESLPDLEPIAKECGAREPGDHVNE